jgi:methyltransferase (TIGR00027 family)
LRYVALDFARGGLRAALAAAGHAPAEPTFWIAEGLVPYLERAAIADMLRAIGQASASGSQLAVSYVTPDLVWLRHARPLFLGALSLIGEPLRSALTSSEVAAMLHDAGFTLASDSDTADWARALCPAQSRAPSVHYERIALGRR